MSFSRPLVRLLVSEGHGPPDNECAAIERMTADLPWLTSLTRLVIKDQSRFIEQASVRKEKMDENMRKRAMFNKNATHLSELKLAMADLERKINVSRTQQGTLNDRISARRREKVELKQPVKLFKPTQETRRVRTAPLAEVVDLCD